MENKLKRENKVSGKEKGERMVRRKKSTAKERLMGIDIASIINLEEKTKVKEKNEKSEEKFFEESEECGEKKRGGGKMKKKSRKKGLRRRRKTR